MTPRQSPRRRPNRGDLAWFQALRADWEQYQPPPLQLQSTNCYRQQLVDFYQQYNPSKLDSVDTTLQKYEGREEELFAKLRAKYESHGGYPVATPSNNDPRVFLEVSHHGGGTIVRIDIQLYQETAPLAAENFRRLCTKEEEEQQQPQLSYRGCSFHRIVAGMCVQGGDITKGDGTGGRSAYRAEEKLTDMWGNFRDDTPFTAHATAGLLSMANNGPHQNGSQFFFTLAALPHLNGKHVVFGRVVKGLEYVLQWGKVDVDENHRPREPITIVDCGEVKTNEDGTERLVRASLSEKGDSPLELDAGQETSEKPHETVPSSSSSSTFGSFSNNPSSTAFSFGITSPQAKSPFTTTQSTPSTLFGAKSQQDQSVPSFTKPPSLVQEDSARTAAGHTDSTPEPNDKQFSDPVSTEPQDTNPSSIGFGSGKPFSFGTSSNPLSFETLSNEKSAPVSAGETNSGFSFNTPAPKAFSFGKPADAGKATFSSFASLANDQKSEPPAAPNDKQPSGFSVQQNPSSVFGSQVRPSSDVDGSAGFGKSSFSFGAASSEPMSFAKLSNDATSTVAPPDDAGKVSEQMPSFGSGSGTGSSTFTTGKPFSFGSPTSTFSFSTIAKESKSVFSSNTSAPKESFGFQTTGTSFAALSTTTRTPDQQPANFESRYRDRAVSDDEDDDDDTTSREDDDSSYNDDDDESTESVDDDDDEEEYCLDDEDLKICVATPTATASPGAISVAVSPPAESILSAAETVQTPTVTNKTEPLQSPLGVPPASLGINNSQESSSQETFDGIVLSTKIEKEEEEPSANVPNNESNPSMSFDRPVGGSIQITDGASLKQEASQHIFGSCSAASAAAVLVEREQEEDVQGDTHHERPTLEKKRSGRKTSRKGDGESRPVESIELPPGLVPERNEAADHVSERIDDDEKNMGYATPDEMSQGAPPITPGGASQNTNRSGNETVGTDALLSSIATWESSVSEQFEMLRKDIDDSASDILRAKAKLTDFQGQIDNRQVATPKHSFSRSLLSTPEREKKTKPPSSPAAAAGSTAKDSSIGSTDSNRGFLTYPSPDRPEPPREPLQHVPSGEEVLSWTLTEGVEELDDESPKKDLSGHSSHILIEDETLEELQKKGGSVDVLVEKFDEHLQSHKAKQGRS